LHQQRIKAVFKPQNILTHKAFFKTRLFSVKKPADFSKVPIYLAVYSKYRYFGIFTSRYNFILRAARDESAEDDELL
jgi:hypothetical protein